MVKSGLVDITEGVPQMQITEEDFNSKNVSELRHLLLSFGLSDEGALEKSELRSRLLMSDRVALISSPKPSAKESSPSLMSSSVSNNAFTVSALRQLSLSELRKLCMECGISTVGCIDKEDVVMRVVQSGSTKVRILPEEDSTTTFSEPHNHAKSSGESISISSSEYSNIYSRDNSNYGSKSDDMCHQPASNHHRDDAMQLSRQLLADFSIRELKDLMRAHGVDSENCLYRSDMIDRLAACSTIQVVD